jgi:membrane-associated PAP2 superfamily phosphatase
MRLENKTLLIHLALLSILNVSLYAMQPRVEWHNVARVIQYISIGIQFLTVIKRFLVRNCNWMYIIPRFFFVNSFTPF